ncbi:hypothetical protein Hanom_Chr12g01154601 [Helianthus anomalus]
MSVSISFRNLSPLPFMGLIHHPRFYINYIFLNCFSWLVDSVVISTIIIHQ